jgi:multidrug efflux pump subunit AcrB
MVDRLNSALHEKGRGDGPAALVTLIAARAPSRLRPIVLTTVTTMLGLLPSAYGVGGDDPLVNPLALTMSWGLLFATLITLFLVPALYMIREDIARRLCQRRAKAIA